MSVTVSHSNAVYQPRWRDLPEKRLLSPFESVGALKTKRFYKTKRRNTPVR